MAARVDAYRDASGRALADYPRPSVAVDTAVLTVDRGRLSVVLVDSAGEARLPGTFLHAGEVLADAVRRSLREKAGLDGIDPEQLHVFDAPGRDDRGWVLTVAHVAVVPSATLPADARPVAVEDAVGLRYDHDTIVRRAVAWLRTAYRDAPDPARLLASEFTLRDLQRVHEAVAGRPVMKDAFRRGMEPKLQPVGELSRGGVGKPARLWRRR